MSENLFLVMKYCDTLSKNSESLELKIPTCTNSLTLSEYEFRGNVRDIYRLKIKMIILFLC